MELDSNIELIKALRKLEMDTSQSSGLKWVSDREKDQNPNIFLALEQAFAFGAVAVYFRFFSDDRPPRPQVYIYSFNDLIIAKSKGPDIHHHLWNAGIVPFCFIFGESQILVYNCGKKPESDSLGEFFITSPHDSINLLGKVQEKFLEYSARQFDSGLFWDSENGKNFKYDQSAYEQLLIQIKNVKNNIISRTGAENAGLVKRILMMLILIKYLEERKDENNRGALNPDEFYKEFNSENPTLFGILNHPDTFLAVLNKLSSKEHFNGQIFLLNLQEQISLRNIDLTIFQHFVEGDTIFFSSGKHGIGQMTLWKLYQFNYLPIELISHIYEDFLTDENSKKKKGVVYTPPYLVQFLIDRCMPLDHPKEHFKILDPACGSGIFLVGAFKRIIQWWRVRNNWEKPQKENIDELKDILLSNIYGCDLEEEAIRLTYFSLSLALLDALSPKEIWKNVHFDNLLGQRLFSEDFFELRQTNSLPNDFDLIIGNPPFESNFTDWAKKVDLTEKTNDRKRPKVPDNQIALLFLEQSLKLLRQGGNCCLILPSGPMLYNTKVHEFKKHLFKNNYFKEIYDFTPLRAKLFIGSSSSAKPVVAAFLAEKNLPDEKPIYHLIFRRTRASGEKIEFEIDHYDIHKVAYNTALNSPRVWQANFMGGGRLHQLVERITAEPTLQKYLDEMIKSRGWKVAEGWIESPESAPLQRIQYLLSNNDLTESEVKELKVLKDKFSADWITGLPFVETEDFIESGIKQTKICKLEYFYRSSKKSKEVFQAPHILVKENVTGKNIPVFFSEEYLSFKDKIFGIHAPQYDILKLQKLERHLKNNYNVPLMWLLSGQVLTSREGVPLKLDILSLPHPESNVELNEIEKVLLDDVLIYYSEFRKEGEKSSILHEVTTKDLEIYGTYYCRILNSVYKDFKPRTPIIGKEFIAYPFVLGEYPEIEIPESIVEIENILRNLIDNRVGYNLWIRRILKVYHKNVIFLYKPNQKRYWLRSIAVRDADETFMDLFNQGK